MCLCVCVCVCVCVKARMCVHLAGSYQGLALPYDRYKRGGDRETLEAKGKQHRADSSTRPNPHINALPVEGR